MNFICHITSYKVLRDNEHISNAAHLFQKKVIAALNPENNFAIAPLPCCGLKADSLLPNQSLKYLNGRGTKSRLLKIIIDYVDVLVNIKKGSANLFYSLNIQSFMLIYFARIFLNCKNYVIIADYESESSYRNFFRKKLQSLINYTYKYCDGVMVLSQNILVHPNTVVVPAIISSAELRSLNTEAKIEKKSILFSGSIGYATGIELALAAMDYLPEHKLYISGKLFFFEEERLITLIQDSKFNNINYLGNLAYEEYLELLDKVEFALSLRNVNDTAHNYNFPSKIMEYLAVNKKVVSTIAYAEIDAGVVHTTASDPKKLAELIVALEKLEQPNSKDYVAVHFGFDNFCKAFETLLKNG